MELEWNLFLSSSKSKAEVSLKSTFLPSCRPQILNSSSEDKGIGCGSAKLGPCSSFRDCRQVSSFTNFLTHKEGPRPGVLLRRGQTLTPAFLPSWIHLRPGMYLCIGESGAFWERAEESRVGSGSWAVAIY